MLALLRSGEAQAESRLYELLGEELRRIARNQLRNHAAARTLQPTALVNEAWMRLARAAGVTPRDRAHFLAVAARAMRSTLADHARSRSRLKRGGGHARLTLEAALDRTLELCATRGLDPIELDDALELLGRNEPRQARLVELRLFGGLTIAEAAEALDISSATVSRDWELARHWLLWELGLTAE